MTSTAPTEPLQPHGTEKPSADLPPVRRPPASADVLEEILPLIGVVRLAGPPVVFLAGPWLLLALMLAGPFAVLFTLAVVLLVAALIVAAIAATPLLVVRHLRVIQARHATPRVLVRQLPADPNRTA